MKNIIFKIKFFKSKIKLKIGVKRCLKKSKVFDIDSIKDNRRIGKTKLLVEIAEKNNAIILVKTFSEKKNIENMVKNKYVSVHVLNDNLNILRAIRKNIVFDEGLSKQEFEIVMSKPNVVFGYYNSKKFKNKK